MRLGKNVGNVYSRGREIQKVYSHGKLVWEKETEDIDYSVIPFTLEVVKGDMKIEVGKNPPFESESNRTMDIKYSINGGEWVSYYDIEYIEIELKEKDVVSIISSDVDYVYTSDGKGFCDIYGNIMSLIYADDFIGKTVWKGRQNRGIKVGMFRELPVIHAKNLILPATTLTNYAYDYMFAGCTSLTTAPELPATTLDRYCYRNMFYNCTSLTTAPELPATTLSIYCYHNMFYNCTSLTTAPELPATTLSIYCYYTMFYNCTSLTTAPELPATTLAEGCYGAMFYNCTSLTTAPELPATTLAEGCYKGMFSQCSSLTTAPELPATTLIQNCYNDMFSQCSSLTTAPELPATTLVRGCYSYMFNGCSNLNYIKCHAKNNLNYISSDWTEGVSPTGILVCKEEAASTLKSTVPEGWTIEYI